MGRGRKSISYAGIKDKRSISVQLACVYGVSPSSINAVSIKDISINGAWESSEIGLGSNLGNRFTVAIKNPAHVDSIPSVVAESGGFFPNYFDRQRFGYRLNNFRIGMHILRNEMEEAVMSFLTESANEIDPESREARTRLSHDQDFQEALEYFPRHLRLERAMIAYLARYRNFPNAIRSMQRGISIMFIHSVEDAIFNAVLERRILDNDFFTGIACGKNFYGFPDFSTPQPPETQGFAMDSLVGYETKEEHISDHAKEIMEKLGLTKESFKIKSLPELSMRGAYRAILSPFKDFSYDGYVAEGSVLMKFSIPPGSYATVFLNEITKNERYGISEMLNEPALV